MADVDLDARLLELTHVARGLEVAAGHVAATLVQDERDAAHAGSADADEVSAANGLRDGRIAHSIS